MALIQTLYPVGNAELSVAPATIMQVAQAGAVAHLKDGLDTTGAYLYDENPGVGLPLFGFWKVIWTLDPASFIGTAGFVRIRVRSSRNAIGTTVWQPLISGLSGLAYQGGLPAEPQAGVGWLDVDLAVDPADGLLWTAAKLNATKLGWRLDYGISGGAGGNYLEVFVREFRAEVHSQVDPPAIPLRGAGTIGIRGSGRL